MLLEILLQYILPVLVPAVVGFGIAFLRKWSKKLDADASASTTTRVLGKTAALAATVVAAVEQAVRPQVQEALKDGKLTDEEKNEIKNVALSRLREYLGPEGLRELADVLGYTDIQSGALDQLLTDHIESAVFRLKSSQAARSGTIASPTVAPSAPPARSPFP